MMKQKLAKNIQTTYFRPSTAINAKRIVRTIATFMLISLMLLFTVCGLADYLAI